MARPSVLSLGLELLLVTISGFFEMFGLSEITGFSVEPKTNNHTRSLRYEIGV